MANTVGKDVSEVNRAYTAGFIDADGAIMATIERHNETKYGFRVRVTVKITQVERKNLEWFQKQFGYGKIAKNRTTYDWLIRSKKDVSHLLRSTIPYLKVKNQQAELAICIADSTVSSKQDLLNLAQLADTLSKFNVRSKKRRKNYAIVIEEAFSRND